MDILSILGSYLTEKDDETDQDNAAAVIKSGGYAVAGSICICEQGTGCYRQDHLQGPEDNVDRVLRSDHNCRLAGAVDDHGDEREGRDPVEPEARRRGDEQRLRKTKK